jgi:class 3 adenylate cyclase/CHASE2 domain-containing sensor protein
VIAVLVGQIGAIESLGMRASDAQFVLRGKLTPPPQILLLVIDQKTYENIPDVQLFWHPFYAEAIRAAADGGAKVMGVDIAFTVPVQKWEPDHDRLLAEAAAETAARMPLVIGYVPASLTRQQEWPVPVNMITSALGLAAFVNLTTDPDSFVRRQELLEAPGKDGSGPPARSLGLRVVEKYFGKDAVIDGSRISIAGQTIPASEDRTIAINYAGPPGTFPSISLWDFLQAARAGNKQQLREWVGDKIVLMGVDSITDRFPTPYFTAFGGSRWTTSGVEIHANTVATLLSGKYLTGLPVMGRAYAAAAVAVATVIAMAWPTGIAGGVLTSALVAAVLVITQILFRFGVLVSFPELLIACGSAIGIAGLYRLTTSHRRSELFGNAVRVFVGHEVVSLLDRSGRIAVKGRHEFVTILFSDIRGFTAYCEEKDPAVVVAVLNEYFTRMVTIVTAHGGVVNKFIGDGMLVIFSEKEKGTVGGDHPSRAVRCGIAMCEAETGFETGVGIHTGVVVIGVVGSADRVEYTVLGDTVNLTSRIEGMNKEQHTRLLMSESTNDLLDSDIQTVPVGAVSIRGQSRKISLYTAALTTKSTALTARQA